MIEMVKNFISAPYCVFCDERMAFDTNECVCYRCRKDIPIVKNPSCRICDRPLPKGYNAELCPECNKEKAYFLQNISSLIYNDEVQDAIKRMKFGNREIWIARELGKILAKTVKEKYSDINFDMIVPVPISQINFVKRKFNQAHEISRPVSKVTGIPIVSDCLIKFKHTYQQSSLGYKERKTNVKGAYRVDYPDKIIDKTILLIDDVYTTGSTINECTRMLKKAGAMAVYTATVAIVAKDI